MSRTEDDELAALLGDDEEDLLVLGDDDLIDDLPEPAPEALQVDEQDLDAFVDAPPDVSYVTEKGSSKDERMPRRRIRFRHLAKLDLQAHPVRWARHLRLEADSQAPPGNPLDGLSERSLLRLAAALQQVKIGLLEDEEVAIITAPIRQFRNNKEVDSVERLALHLNATPVEGIVILKMVADTARLVRGLLKLGLSEGRDYEFIEASALLPYERTVFDTLLGGSKTRRLRILRRLSKTQAKV